MRSGSNINTILREIATLPPEDQVYVSEVLYKRIQDMKRELLISRAEEAQASYLKNKFIKGTAEDLINTLSND
jgi:hypothetical protein